MKIKFLSCIVLLLCLTFTSTVEAKALSYENSETHFIGQSLIAGDIDVLQISESTSNEVGNFNDSEGFNLYYEGSSRYITSTEGSRQSANISTYNQIIRGASTGKIQTSYSKFKQNRQRNFGGMRMYGAEDGSRNLQGDNYNPKGNNYIAKGNDNANNQRAQLFSESLFLVRSHSIIDVSRYFNWQPVFQKNKEPIIVDVNFIDKTKIKRPGKGIA